MAENRRKDDTMATVENSANNKPTPRRKRRTFKHQSATAADTTTVVQPSIQQPQQQQLQQLPLQNSLGYWVKIKEPADITLLETYVMPKEKMAGLGFPTQTTIDPNKVIIFKSSPRHMFSRNGCNIYAREFVPRGHQGSTDDSGQGSSNSNSDTEGSDSNNEASTVDVETKPSDDAKCLICVRCRGVFHILPGKRYTAADECRFHHGKLQYTGTVGQYSCCGGVKFSPGCCQNKHHVWSGLKSGVNGPYYDFVVTGTPNSLLSDGNYGVYAMDCEMVYTIDGMEVAKVTLVGFDGQVVYDTYVQPENEIFDYNTFYSGITAGDLRNAKKLIHVQLDLLRLINSKTILIGHGLENDLRALKMVHYRVVDTAVVFPDLNGCRQSLKCLMWDYLRKRIQSHGGKGHDSLEDSLACLELMLWRIKSDFYQYRR